MPRRTTGGREPREWLADADVDKFGVIRKPRWKSAGSADRAALAAAQHQHDISRQAKARMRDIGLNNAETAKRAGMNVDTLGRILNGRTYPTLFDLHCIATAVEVPFVGGYLRPGDRSINDAG